MEQSDWLWCSSHESCQLIFHDQVPSENLHCTWYFQVEDCNTCFHVCRLSWTHIVLAHNDRSLVEEWLLVDSASRNGVGSLFQRRHHLCSQTWTLECKPLHILGRTLWILTLSNYHWDQQAIPFVCRTELLDNVHTSLEGTCDKL